MGHAEHCVWAGPLLWWRGTERVLSEQVLLVGRKASVLVAGGVQSLYPGKQSDAGGTHELCVARTGVS